MVRCEKCFSLHDGSYGSGRFCKSECARSFSTSQKREAINAKVSISLKGRKSTMSDVTMIESAKRQSETKLEKILNTNFHGLGKETKKRRVILEQYGKCFICGISEWMGKPLTLAVDHIDGNNQNDARENLRGLCPNCHSQTTTYCGRNQEYTGRKLPRIGDDVLLAALISSKTIADALRSLGRTPNPHAYDRCKALLLNHKRSASPDLQAW